MTSNRYKQINYYVDEAGDPTLFSRRGKILIGSEGCSKYFILGKLDIENPDAVAQDLDDLRKKLLSDPYFKDVPSMRPEQLKTAVTFHANNDLAEVRWEVFKILREHRVRFYAVVRDKHELLAYVKQENERDSSYRYNPNELYDTLVTELFKGVRPIADTVKICFSKRGKKDRTIAMRKALEKAETDFEKRFGFKRNVNSTITSFTPIQKTGLQAVDYYLWALQRFYERGEERFIEMLWDQIGEIHDLDTIVENKRGTFFSKKRPLNNASRPL